MCNHCSTHWLDLDLETGEPKRQRGQAIKQEPILEAGCDDCKRFFGWVIHRHYAKGVGIMIPGAGFSDFPNWLVGYWNEDRSLFTLLGRFMRHSHAYAAVEHLSAD